MKGVRKNGALKLVPILAMACLVGISDLQAKNVFNWSGLSRFKSSVVTGVQPPPIKKGFGVSDWVDKIPGAFPMGGRIVVTSLKGNVSLDGSCSLTEAMLLAETGLPAVMDFSDERSHLLAGECAGVKPDFNVIVLPEGEIVLKEPYGASIALPRVKGRLLIQGKGISKSFIKRSGDDKTPSFGIFFVESVGDLTLQDLSIVNGDAPAGANTGGGAVYNYSGHLALKNCGLSRNRSETSGGALYNSKGGVVDIQDSYFMENTAWDGGAVFSLGVMSVSGSSFYKNHASMSLGHGGGIYAVGELRVENSTIAGNDGEGVYVGDPTKFPADPKKNDFDFDSVTIALNKGFGLNLNPDASASVVIHNSLLAGNYGGDAVGPIKSAGFNVIAAGSDSSASSVMSDQIGSVSKPLDARLGSATFDKDGNYFIPLTYESPAVDQGDPKRCPATDQRGLARPQGSGCDIGAYELPALFPVE